MNLRTVRIVGLPIEIHRAASEHSDAVNRELELIAASEGDSVPARLQALSERLTAQFSAMASAQREQLEAATTSQAETIDLEYQLPVEAADGAEELGRMLDEVDEYCRQGELLSLITPPEALTYRRWFLSEFVRQLRDEAPPISWAEFVATAPPEAPAEPAAAPDAVNGTPVTVGLTGALDLEGATTFRTVIADAVDNGAAHLVIDLTQCDFIDSVGLSLLLATRARCVEQGGSLRVENLQPFVRSTLRVAGVLEILSA